MLPLLDYLLKKFDTEIGWASHFCSQMHLVLNNPSYHVQNNRASRKILIYKQNEYVKKLFLYVLFSNYYKEMSRIFFTFKSVPA